MKGVIPDCMAKLVVEKKGKDIWEKILENAGLDKNTIFLANQDVDDATVMRVIDSLCTVLDKSLQDTANAFGIYWVNYYAARIYRTYFGKSETAKEFLLKMDEVHSAVTKNIKNACPPRFEYEQPDEKTVIMTYKSERGLMEFFIGLIKGAGKYFNEDLTVIPAGNNKVKIIFPPVRKRRVTTKVQDG